MALTDRQRRFCEEYIIDLNATQAAIRAGYAVKTAQEQSSRLLSNVMVQAEIQRLQRERSERTQIRADRVLREIACLAFSDIGEILDFTGTDPRLRPACKIPEHARRAISSFKVRRYVEGPGEESREVEVTEFKLWSKDSNLEKLAKHLGLLKDQVEVTGKDGGPIEATLIDQSLARLRQARGEPGNADEDGEDEDEDDASGPGKPPAR